MSSGGNINGVPGAPPAVHVARAKSLLAPGSWRNGLGLDWLRTVARRIRNRRRRRQEDERIGHLYGLIIDRLDAGVDLLRPDFHRVAQAIRGTERQGSLLIGLTVHESPACVIDQVANLARFAPEASVVLHLAASLRRQLGDEVRLLARNLANVHPSVIVNPRSFETVYGSGSLLQAQVSNWIIARERGSFARFCLMSSNELLVRRGLEQHLAGTDVAVSFNAIDVPGATAGMWRSRVRRASILGDPIFAHVMGRNSGRPIVQGIHEGLCMRAEFWDEFARIFDLEFPHHEVHYPTEEIYLHNLLQPVMEHLRAVPPICSRHLGGVTAERVAEVRSGAEPEHFSLKRIARRIDDPMRRMIRELPD